MNDNIVGWFSTEDGTHIPIKNGQSKKQAIEERFNSNYDSKTDESSSSDVDKYASISLKNAKFDQAEIEAYRKAGYGIFPNEDKLIHPNLAQQQKQKLNEINEKIPVKPLRKYDTASQIKHNEQIIKNGEAQIEVYKSIGKEYVKEMNKAKSEGLKALFAKKAKWNNDFAKGQEEMLEAARKQNNFLQGMLDRDK